MYKYLFGPVPSRRLGLSLGVDLVPHKVCSLNCVYCECGATTKLTLNRAEYVPYKNLIEELDDYFKNQTDPDYITFSGAGEPTLNSRIGDVINYIKERKPNIPVAVISNATLFYDKQLRRELLAADLVLPSLDAASEKLFKKMDRTAKGLSVESHIQGLIDFRKEFNGKIWLEVFILPNYNNKPEELEKLKNAIVKINPDSVQLNTLDRPGTLQDIYAASQAELQAIADKWNLPFVQLVSKNPQRNSIKSYREDVENVILETIARRPSTLSDLKDILGINIVEINKYLDVLNKEKKIKVLLQERGAFYQLVSK